jgi:hypothetical protein
MEKKYQMKNNISFYRHNVDSHNHWKFKTLRRKFGWCGEGKFWALNNMIGESENCSLDLTDEYKKLAIAADLDFELAELDEFIEFLSLKCKLIVFEEGKATTGMVQEVFSDVDTRRQRQREFKKQKSLQKVVVSPEKTEESIEKVQVSTVENEQSRADQSKEEKSKVKKNRNLLSISDEMGNADRELKKAYSELLPTIAAQTSKDAKANLHAWIIENKPQFIEPYADFWNLFAMTVKVPQVKSVSDMRRKKFNTRIREPAFDFFEILKKIRDSRYLKGETENWGGATFDWILENEGNYLKILEGNYK